MKYLSLRRLYSDQPGIYTEVKSSLRLAVPLVLTQLLDGMMGLVDTLVAGTLDTVAIASLAAANGLFWAVICMMGGFFAGLDTYIPRAFGEQNQAKANQLLIQGLWIALAASCMTILLVVLFASAYDVSSTPREVVSGMWTYLAYVLPSAPIILVIGVMQRYWQSQNFVKPFTLLMIAMNCLNLVLDFGLVEGWFGPRFGVNGIALSTTLCRVFALSAVILWSLYTWKCQGLTVKTITIRTLKPNKKTIQQLLGIGLPSFGHLAADVFAFNFLTFLAAQFGVIPLAAHQIMFMVTCITVMVPIGISNAACIRIGQLIGEGDLERAVLAARTNLMFCMLCMGFSGAVLFANPHVVIQWFTDDPLLVSSLIPLIKLCGVLQIADGLQMVYVGILRAYGEVKRVFIYSLVSHYVIGLPIGLLACYVFKLGVMGLWVGITAALFSAWGFNWMLSRDSIPT